MSEIPRQIELIQSAYSFADKVATLSNIEITAALGCDADWQYWVGQDSIPEEFKGNCSPEKFQRLSDLWELRESASGYACDLESYAPTEWAKQLYESAQKTEINWEEQYSRQIRINETLIAENHTLAKKATDAENALCNLRKDFTDLTKSSDQNFRCLKAEIITSLRAINLCLIASLCTDSNFLTHRARNFRMKHVNQIIKNEIERFGDRKIFSYEDDL